MNDFKEKIGRILDETMERAKINREHIPHSKSDGFAQAIIFIGPTFEVETVPGIWRNEQEKYSLMRAVSNMAKRRLAMVVILVADTRWVEGDKIAPLLGIPTLAETAGLEEWTKLYQREVTKRFKGYLGNMPPEWYSEALIVIAKGPGLGGPMARMARYEKGPNDSIQWVQTPAGETYSDYHFNLLPDWWC